MNYTILVEDALRGVVRTALEKVRDGGLPGEHHFYLSFRTDDPETEISDALHAQYPEEMTIVLQHKFWGLEVGAKHFEINLSFNKVPEFLRVPYRALTGFFDPSVQFSLQFKGDADADKAAPSGATNTALPAAEATALIPAPDGRADSGADEKVVTLDQFRKK